MDAGGKSREESPKKGTTAPGMNAAVTEPGTFVPRQSSHRTNRTPRRDRRSRACQHCSRRRTCQHAQRYVGHNGSAARVPDRIKTANTKTATNARPVAMRKIHRWPSYSPCCDFMVTPD